MFTEEKMYQFVYETAVANNLSQTLKALPYAHKMHEGQYRRGDSGLTYITHPLMIACHAINLGLTDDKLIAAILLHDVCEDCMENGIRVSPDMLPVSEDIQHAVALVSKPEDKYLHWKEDYYKGIAANPIALKVKLLDRCHNISNMANAFNQKKMLEYIDETRNYIMPLLDIWNDEGSEESNRVVFLVRYHMESVLDSIEKILEKKH